MNFLSSKIISSKTLQDIIKVFTGNFMAQGIGFLISVYVSRDLGPERYGVFALLLSIYLIISQLTDFGIATSYVKYGSEIKLDKTKYKSLFWSTTFIRILISVLITLITILLSPKISEFFFGTKMYEGVISLIAVTITFNSLFALLVSHYQALQKFVGFSVLNIANQIIKLLGVIVVTMFIHENKHIEAFLYIYTYSFGVIVIGFILRHFKKISISHMFIKLEHLKVIYKLGFWVFLSSIAVLLMMRLDIMMIQKIGMQKDVGYYAAANQLAMVFPLITGSITATLLPKVDQFLKTKSLKIYIGRILKYAKWVLLSLLMIEIVSPFLILLLFGDAYKNSISVFQILIAAYVIGVIINPISLLFYSLNKAHLLTALNWIQLPINFVGNLFFIPLLGAPGAALSTSLVNVFAGLFIVFHILKMIKSDTINQTI